MKHINILQLLSIAILLLFIGCEQEIKPEQEIKEPISVVGISLSRSSVEMLEGDTFALTVTIEPSNADDKSVSWTSSRPSIASVQEGVITAHKAGNATITVKTTDGGLTVKCNVVVKEKAGVTLDKTSLELTEGDTEVLTATVYPSNAPNKNVYWTSSNPVIATVDNGKVTAMQEGTATITVTTEDGRHTATCEVKVLRIRVEGVYLDKDSIEMLEGSAITLSATITPENASNKNLIWTSSDETVATVDNGKVTAMQEGTATITVTTEDGGKTATCIVKVWGIPVEDISLDKTSIEMTEGDEIILTATITPENALNKNLIWTSSDETVATVDNGKVTAMQEGTATITVKTEDGGKTATCEVIVIHDSSNDAIVFADDVIKEMCVAAFDANGDGELSYKEAAAVTDLSQMALTKKRFKSFDEFQYFNSIEVIPNDYFAKTTLASISLPSSIIHIGDSAFLGCQMLSSIIIPEGVEYIEYSTFEGCSNLTSVFLPASIISIEDSAFYNCTSLQSIDLPHGLISLGHFTFGQCMNLQSIQIPSSVTSMGPCLFENCGSLNKVNIPEGITTIEGNNFYGCKSLTKIKIPDSVFEIHAGAFAHSGIQNVVIPDNVTYLEGWVFDQCTQLLSIYMTSPNPPMLESNYLGYYDQFDGNKKNRKIYVPYNSLKTYKTANGWSVYADDIVGYDYENNKVVE